MVTGSSVRVVCQYAAGWLGVGIFGGQLPLEPVDSAVNATPLIAGNRCVKATFGSAVYRDVAVPSSKRWMESLPYKVIKNAISAFFSSGFSSSPNSWPLTARDLSPYPLKPVGT